MSVRVRPLEARDKPVWLVLFKGYIEFYQATVPEDVIETLWQRLMRGDGGVPHRRSLPSTAATRRSAWRTCCSTARPGRNGWYCYLEDLFVDPAQRQKGVGRALIEAVYAEPTRAGCSAHLLDDAGDQLRRRARSTTAWRPSRRSCSIGDRAGVRPCGSDTIMPTRTLEQGVRPGV